LLQLTYHDEGEYSPQIAGVLAFSSSESVVDLLDCGVTAAPGANTRRLGLGGAVAGGALYVPAWVTVCVRPATVIVPVRAPPVFGSTW